MEPHVPSTVEILGCPECDAPAEVVAGHHLPCTEGPIEHVRVWCAAGHVFLMPREMLQARLRL
jgi:hypothetical protein